MTNQQILEKAIAKAEENGFNFGPSENGRPPKELFTRNMMQDLFFRQALLFNHDFAKALWGDKFINPEMRDDKGSRIIAMQQTAWRHHLRQMVTADDPIQYLGDNI